MSEIVILTWDNWEAMFINGEKVASGHSGRVNKLKAVEGRFVKQVKQFRVFPKNGNYTNSYADTLSDVENYKDYDEQYNEF
jgi:DNA/RNA endonuclease YhcR with UshA esterase domain